MKTLIVYYSYWGNTKRMAESLAKEQNADCLEIKEKRRPNVISAFTTGVFAAIRQKSSQIEPIETDLSLYQRFIVMAPIWAGHPAPAINNVFDLLPPGREVELRMVSNSGQSSGKERTLSLARGKGCKVTDYIDIKC